MVPDETSRLNRTLERIDRKVDDIGERLAKIEQRVDDLSMPGQGPACRVHHGELERLSDAVGKVSDQQARQNLIAVVLSAFTAAVLMAGKWLLGTR